MAHRDVVVSDLTLAGFVLNIPKSHLDPQQVGRWLGFVIDLLEGNFHILDDNWRVLDPPLEVLILLVQFRLDAWPRLWGK